VLTRWVARSFALVAASLNAVTLDVMHQSHAILRYLHQKYHTSLFSSDAQVNGRIEEALEFITNSVYSAGSSASLARIVLASRALLTSLAPSCSEPDRCQPRVRAVLGPREGRGRRRRG